MGQKIPARSLIRRTAQQVRDRMVRGRLDQILVVQAKRRIDAAGDSTHKYPELWANKVKGHYRAGGQPLRATGTLYNGLTSTISSRPRTVRLKLQHPRKYPLMLQEGFTTKGPNYIPIKRAAARFNKVRDALAAGLKWGKDFIVVKRGVTVPPRKIFNMPPENRRELVGAVGQLTGGRVRG